MKRPAGEPPFGVERPIRSQQRPSERQSQMKFESS